MGYKDKYANIILLGRTGVGKSSFINYIVGKDVCETGDGKPVTQDFKEYKYDNVDGIPLRIIDTKGIEVLELENNCRAIKEYIAKHCRDKDIFNWIHSIFYCINLKRGRLEDEEIRFIKGIKKEISQTVHIIITNCKNLDDDNLLNMINYVKEVLGSNTKICCVNSVVSRTRKGIVTPKFGREKVLEQLFYMLWQDISTHISYEYAKEFRKKAIYSIYKIRYMAIQGIDNVSNIKTIKDFMKGNEENIEVYFDNILNDIDECIEKNEDEMAQKYSEIVNPLIDFYNAYSKSIGSTISLKYDDFLDSLDLDVDIDGIFENSKIMKKIEKLEAIVDNIDEDDILAAIGAIVKGVVGIGELLLRWKSMFKEVIDDIVWELEGRIPQEYQLAEHIYTTFMKQLNMKTN